MVPWLTTVPANVVDICDASKADIPVHLGEINTLVWTMITLPGGVDRHFQVAGRDVVLGALESSHALGPLVVGRSFGGLGAMGKRGMSARADWP